MKLYALRDRLIGYYLQPFTAENDNAVKASLAETINGDHPHALTKSPHHFELWCLLEINQETGCIVDAEPEPEFICDCSSLVREDFRERGVPRNPAMPRIAPNRQGAPIGAQGGPSAQNGSTPRSPPAAPVPGAEAGAGHHGVLEPPDGHSER